MTDAALYDETLRSLPVRIIGLPGDKFVDHGAVGDLRHALRLDVEGISEQVREAATALGFAETTAPSRTAAKQSA
jgi:hypothetical protein